jgi:hypothetical protein
MNKAVRGFVLLLSWVASLGLGDIAWGTVKQIDIETFDAWPWFVTLFVANWIGINFLLTVFLVRGLPDFVYEKAENAANAANAARSGQAPGGAV